MMWASFGIYRFLAVILSREDLGVDRGQVAVADADDVAAVSPGMASVGLAARLKMTRLQARDNHPGNLLRVSTAEKRRPKFVPSLSS